MDGKLLDPGRINAGVVAAVATLTLLAGCSDAPDTGVHAFNSRLSHFIHSECEKQSLTSKSDY